MRNPAAGAPTVFACAAALLAVAPASPPRIPLCPGLTIVTAIVQPDGDYESIKTITSVDASAVTMRYYVDLVHRDLPGNPRQRARRSRTIHRVDLRDSALYLQEFGYSTPEDVPGTTSLGTSSLVLRRLRETGLADLTVFDVPGGLRSDPPYSTDRKVHPNLFDHEVVFKLRRVESAPVMLPVIVNDVKIDLPAIHAAGSAEWGEKGEFFFLDDEDNPLSLRFRIRTSEQLRHGLWIADVEQIEADKPVPVPEDLQSTARALEQLVHSLQDKAVDPQQMPVQQPLRLDDCGWVANRWCELLPLPVALKQRLLELDNPLVRLELVSDVLARTGIGTG